jgi:hypothetical protein
MERRGSGKMTFGSKEISMNIIKAIIAKKINDGVIGDPHPPQRSLMDKLTNVKSKAVIAFAAVAGLIAAAVELM